VRVIVDTNIYVSALLSPSSSPGIISYVWLDDAFTLLISLEQLDELRCTLRKPYLLEPITRHEAGTLINNLKKYAELVPSSPRVHRSPDPTDDFLLAMCSAGKADFLVTGDKGGLLSLGNHGRTQIVSAKDFATRFR
jgi:putative PIN family toxin of toxin-antitoxin system